MLNTRTKTYRCLGITSQLLMEFTDLFACLLDTRSWAVGVDFVEALNYPNHRFFSQIIRSKIYPMGCSFWFSTLCAEGIVSKHGIFSAGPARLVSFFFVSFDKLNKVAERGDLPHSKKTTFSSGINSKKHILHLRRVKSVMC